MSRHGSRIAAVAIAGALAGIALATVAVAQQPVLDTPELPDNVTTAALIAQDFSDCTNTTVQNDPNRTRGGEIWVTRNDDGTTSVQIGMTVEPDTTYHFFLKCVRLLGDIATDDEGVALATFDFQTSEVGSTFAFDMYPEGAPAGNKFQSTTVTFP
jgi:hypothetical protein